MPPKWSLGYQQCRWSYLSDARVREVEKCLLYLFIMLQFNLNLIIDFCYMHMD